MRQQVHFNDFDGLNQVIASGFGEWGPPLRIDQALIDDFAAAISRASAAVAAEPETMLPAMLPRLEPGMDWEVSGAAHALNLGCPEIRFLAPVRIGAAVRLRTRLAAAQRFARGTKITMTFEAEIAETKDVCMTLSLAILFLPGSE